MRFARIAQLMSAALFPLLSACSLLTGQQSVPPPWDSNAAPSQPVSPPGQGDITPSPSVIKLDGTISNPSGYPIARSGTPPAPPKLNLIANSEPSPPVDNDSIVAPQANASMSDSVPPPPAAPVPEMSMPVPAVADPSYAPIAEPAITRNVAPPSRPQTLSAVPRLRLASSIGTWPATYSPAPVVRTAVEMPRANVGVPAPVVDAVPAAPAIVAGNTTIQTPGQKPDGFIAGPGDLVTITVFGRPELLVNANVSDDGKVPMALIGNVQIGGLSPVQASDRIAAALRDGGYLVDPKVSVVFNEYRSRQISVLGEVKLPGRFPVNTRMTVLDAIALAGGINDLGSQSALILRPQGTIVTRYEVDIDELLDAGVGQQYFDVEGGDTVIVPRAEVFYIYGEVKTPSMYKLRPGMTVVQALSMGGGLTDKGSDRRVEIRRRSADGKLIKESASLSDVLEPDDVVYVHERLF